MQNLVHPDKIFHFGVSPSMVGTWNLCKRAWYNHYIRGLKKEDRGFARFGNGLHFFLRYWQNPNTKTKRDMLTTLIRGWRLWYPKTYDFVSPSGTVRTQELGEKIIKKYAEIYPKESEPFKVLDTEKHQQVIISPLKKPLNFRRDATIEYRNGIWLKENKTTAKGGASYFKQFLVDYQPVCYIKGTQEEIKKKVEGVFYDIICCKKVVDDKSFMRDDEVGCKTQEQIDYHWDCFVRTANRMIDYVYANWQDVNAFDPAESAPACWSYHTACAYLDMCEMCDNTNLFDEGKKGDIV